MMPMVGGGASCQLPYSSKAHFRTVMSLFIKTRPSAHHAYENGWV